jgi:hypothetical protein
MAYWRVPTAEADDLWYSLEPPTEATAKEAHSARLRRHGHFYYVKAGVPHHTELCPEERWMGFALTLEPILPVLDPGLPEGELGLARLWRVAERPRGAKGLPWYVSYHVRMVVT